MGVAEILMFVATALNIASVVYNLRMRRRMARALLLFSEQYGKLAAFAAWMAAPEFGAPEGVRKMAREALPEGTTVVVSRDASPHVH